MSKIHPHFFFTVVLIYTPERHFVTVWRCCVTHLSVAISKWYVSVSPVLSSCVLLPCVHWCYYTLQLIKRRFDIYYRVTCHSVSTLLCCWYIELSMQVDCGLFAVNATCMRMETRMETEYQMVDEGKLAIQVQVQTGSSWRNSQVTGQLQQNYIRETNGNVPDVSIVQRKENKETI